MAFLSNNITQRIQEKLKTLNSLIHKIEETKNHSKGNLEEVLQVEQNYVNDDARRLKHNYEKRIADSQKEITLIRAALGKIQEVRNIKHERRIQAKLSGNKEMIRRGILMKMLSDSATTMPLFIRTSAEESIPPLCGCIPPDPFHIAKVGDMVAALVKTTTGERNWILAEVIRFNEFTKKYEVDDIDEEDKVRYEVSKRRVVPLPIMKVNPHTEPEALYQINTLVMALFPQTTCFYPAVVCAVPEGLLDDYHVIFIDSMYRKGQSPPMPVSQRFIFSVSKDKWESARI